MRARHRPDRRGRGRRVWPPGATAIRKQLNRARPASRSSVADPDFRVAGHPAPHVAGARRRSCLADRGRSGFLRLARAVPGARRAHLHLGSGVRSAAARHHRPRAGGPDPTRTSALADPVRGRADRSRDHLPLWAEPHASALALGQLGRGRRDRHLDARLHRVLALRPEFRQLQRPTARSAPSSSC